MKLLICLTLLVGLGAINTTADLISVTAGQCTGSGFMDMADGFDSQPTDEPPTDNGVGNDLGGYNDRYGYIDFGTSYATIQITSLWSSYREWTTGAQNRYQELWWDDDIDMVNDGTTETTLTFDYASVPNQGDPQWLENWSGSAVTPANRYLIAHTLDSGTSNRVYENAFFSSVAVPEPGTLSMLVIALTTLLGLRKLRRS